MKQKLALINVFFAPQSIGGATRVVEDTVAEIIRAYGDLYELTIFCTDATFTPEELSIFDGLETGNNYPKIGELPIKAYSYKGIRVYQARAEWRPNMDWYHISSDNTALFGKFLDLENPDLVHFHCIQRIGIGALEQTKSRNIPSIVTIHDAWWISDYQFLYNQEKDEVYPNGHADDFALPEPPEGISTSESINRRFELRQALLVPDKLLSVSQSFKAIYEANQIKNIEVNSNGVARHLFNQDRATQYTDKVVLAHIGGMANHKGYPLLRKALTSANTKNIELLVVDHSKPPSYRMEVVEFGLKVTYIGYQRQSETHLLYPKIDVLMAPSIWPESFGLVTREAAACKCWVVASDIGGIGEDIDEDVNGHRVKANNLQSLVDVINTINANPQKYKKSITPSQRINTIREQVEELVEQHYQPLLEKVASFEITD